VQGSLINSGKWILCGIITGNCISLPACIYKQIKNKPTLNSVLYIKLRRDTVGQV